MAAPGGSEAVAARRSTNRAAAGAAPAYPFAGSADRLSYALKGAGDARDGWVTISFDPSDPADTCATPLVEAQDAVGDPLDGSTVDAGDAFTLDGTDWPAGEVLTVTLESTPVVVGTATVLGTGAFAFAGTIPVSAAGGAHTVVLTPASATLPTLRFAVTVIAAPPVPAPALAATGADAMPLALGAGVLLLAGIAVLLTRRLTVARARD